MVSTQWILKPKFCRECTLQKHEPFGNCNRTALANLNSYTYPCLMVWVDKKAGNVGAQSSSNSTSAIQRRWTQGLSLWRLVCSCGWCLEIWGCPWVPSGEPELSFTLYEGGRAVVRKYMSPFPTWGPLFGPFLSFDQNNQTWRFLRDGVTIKWERYGQSPECTNKPYGPCPGPHFSALRPSAPAPAVLQQGWSPGPRSRALRGRGSCWARPTLTPRAWPWPVPVPREVCSAWGALAALLLARRWDRPGLPGPVQPPPGERPWLWVPGPGGAPVPCSSLAGALGNVQSGSRSSSCIPDPEMSRGDASFHLLMLGGWDTRALPPVPPVLGRPAAETAPPQALGKHSPNSHQDLQCPEDFLQLSFRLADPRCASDSIGKWLGKQIWEIIQHISPQNLCPCLWSI